MARKSWGAVIMPCSPFGGIPRNWKHEAFSLTLHALQVPPSGGSLEIGNVLAALRLYEALGRSPFGGIPRNWKRVLCKVTKAYRGVPPSGGSLEIGNNDVCVLVFQKFAIGVPPSGGSLEIGNHCKCRIV